MTTTAATPARTLRTRITLVVAALMLVAVVLAAWVSSLRVPFDPVMLAVRLTLATIVALAIGVTVSRVVTRPIRQIVAQLAPGSDARVAAGRVRIAALEAPREIADLGAAVATLLDDAATRAAAIERQRLELVDTNTALNEERRRMLRVERQREASDLLLDAVVHVLPDALVVVDEQHHIRVWSHVAAALFRVDDAQAFGQDFIATYLAAVHRDEARHWWKQADAARFEIVATRGDGSEFPAELTLTPVSTPRGRYHAVSVRDLARAKQVEAEARQAQKLEAVGRLASGIAHELNTPIQFIGDSVTFAREASLDLQRLVARYRDAVRAHAPAAVIADLADDEVAADLDYLVDELPRSFERTVDGVERVATIVRSMKEFAHPEASDKTMTDLNRAIASTLAIARNEVKYAAAVETDFGDLPPIECHAGELNQVFLNLLINAAHAIQDSGKHADGALGTIRVVTRADADQIVVSISDDGCGIPETARAKIYDPFFTTKSVGRGTGQGLAIARTVVIDKHRGAIWFDSQVGIGTTFHVRLPLH